MLADSLLTVKYNKITQIAKAHSYAYLLQHNKITQFLCFCEIFAPLTMAF